MKIAVAAIAAIASAQTYASYSGVKATLNFGDEPAEGATATYTVMAWVNEGTTGEGDAAVTSNYILVETSKAQGTYTATADYHGLEWVLLQYDNVGSQDYWEVTYTCGAEVDGAVTAWAEDTPVLTTVSYAESSAKASDDETATDLSAAAVAATGDYPITLEALSYSTNVWDGTDDWPGHTASKKLPTATSGTNVVPVYVEDEFTVWYQVQNFAASTTAVTSAALTDDDSRTTLWGAASSLTAAATVVVAASLF